MERPELPLSALDAIFKPRSIAVIGATRRRGSIGREILANLLDMEFNGKVFPVNPNEEVLHSIKCYPKVTSIPDRVDLAIIVVPSAQVVDVVRECGTKGVKGLVVITAGFKEVGPRGAELEQKLIELVHEYGMRMIGPNCMGVINTDPEVSMDATFASVQPLRGRIGFMSQSGALGEAILAHARRLRLGFSMFASMGNKTDVSGNDLMRYWEADPNTDLILLYLESVGNPRRFTQVARQISRKKPILAVKSGRTAAGARAVSSHTGAMLLSGDAATEALFEQCGVLRVSTIEELFDLALAFSTQSAPQGRRVAILTNAGGPGILATDACVGLGLQIAELAPLTKAALRACVLPEASVENPVDVLPAGGPETYRSALAALLDDPGVDSVLAIHVMPIMINAEAVAHSITEISRGRGKPVLGVFMGSQERLLAVSEVLHHRVPMYAFPESAVKALAALTRYHELREQPAGQVRDFPREKERAAAVVAQAQAEGREWLSQEESLRVLDAYGIPVAKARVTSSAEQAVAAAREIGFPVVLKIEATGLVHKSDVGGVVKDVPDEGTLRARYAELETRGRALRDAGVFRGILVQQFLDEGRETILGVAQDPSFGPLVMFGLGGVLAEAIQDVAFKVHPITNLDAEEMIGQVRGHRLLDEFRGQPAVDRPFLAEVLQRLSLLAGDLDQIIEMDVNPFLAAPPGKPSCALDARIRIAITVVS
jgi:acetyltransferase